MATIVNDVHSAGQGSLPPVPEVTLSCTYCGGDLNLAAGNYPAKCPHCGKILRPYKESAFYNFLFALRKSFSIMGRATRLEFWPSCILTSALIIVCSIFLIIHLFRFWLLDNISPYNCLLFSGISAGFIIMLAVFQFCLLVRRLHDLELSGFWVFLYIVTGIICFAAYFVTFTWSVQEFMYLFKEYNLLVESLNFISSDCCIMSTAEVLDWFHVELPDSDVVEQRLKYCLLDYPFIYRFILQLIFIFNTLLGIFLLVASLLDSKPGTNKYGLCRKYPVA